MASTLSLMLACANGDEATVIMLIKNNANIEAVDEVKKEGKLISL